MSEGIATQGPIWAAWREALREAAPRGAPGEVLVWELGPLRVTVQAGLGAEVALAVAAGSGLDVWALLRSACPSEVGQVQTGDRAFDREVLLVGDTRVLAVLDEATRTLLRGLIVNRRARLEGGVLRLDGGAAAALQADQIGSVLGAMGELAARLGRAVSDFDAELAAHLEAASEPVRAQLAAAFPTHAAVTWMRLRALLAEAERADATPNLAALLAVAESRTAGSAERLEAARTILAATTGPTLAPEAWAVLTRLGQLPTLPATLLHTTAATLYTTALERVLLRGPASAFPSLAPELQAEHLGLIVAAMRRSAEHRQAGVRQLLGSQADETKFRYAGSLAQADLGFVAEALAELGGPPAALGLCLAAWDANPNAQLVPTILGALARVGVALEAFFGALDERGLDHMIFHLPRVAAQLEDGVAALVALYPHLRDGGERRAFVAAFEAAGDARATVLLVEALASRDDALVDAAIGALGAVGDARALKALEREAGGFFRDRTRKAAAREAALNIRARVGDPEGALAVASGSGGEVALADESRRDRS